jgi:hypothetical protein
MSSLKSLAAAKNRRSNEPQQQPMSRPGTSIASHAAFAQHHQQQYQGGGRGPRGQPPQQQQPRYQQEQIQQQPTNGLPFSKLTVSDAIGLITLRLGKVEQFLIDVQQDGGLGGISSNGENSIPDNMKLVDNSVLTSMINRLDGLEKRDQSGSSETLVRLEKELKETKEMLLNLMFKYELFTKEIQQKFLDHEQKFLDHEQKFLDHDTVFAEIDTALSQKPVSFNDFHMTGLEGGEELEAELEVDPEQESENESGENLSANLKNMIKQEFQGEE